MAELRVVHYLNQFFAGMGGEDKAGIGPRVMEGATGPGRAVQMALGERGKVMIQRLTPSPSSGLSISIRAS